MSKSICSFVAPVFSLFLLAACSQANFNEKKKDEPERVETADQEQVPRIERKTQLPGNADLGEGVSGEQQRSLEPQEVSGSFLACIPIESEIGCAIVTNGRKSELKPGKMTWFARDDRGDMQTISIRHAAAGSAWHVLLSSDSSLKGSSIRVEVVQDGDKKKSYVTKVSVDQAVTETSDQDAAIHLGNGDFSGSSCVDDLADVPTFGQTVRFEVQTESSSSFLIVLHGLCGVDDPNLVQMSVVTDVGTYKTSNVSDADSLEILTPRTSGTFFVDVTAAMRADGDIEDFLFTHLSIQGAGVLVLKAK